jgi:hypothetical protein
MIRPLIAAAVVFLVVMSAASAILAANADPTPSAIQHVSLNGYFEQSKSSQTLVQSDQGYYYFYLTTTNDAKPNKALSHGSRSQKAFGSHCR